MKKLLKARVGKLRAMVGQHFPHLWQPVLLGLATCATLLLKDNKNPVAVIYVGPPSAGKSTVAEMFAEATVNGEELCYVSDEFTAASFVSQAGQVSSRSLSQVDLLPRIQYKVLVTPELAPMFRGKEEELSKRFSILTRVLDGEGLKRDGAVHGSRGYRGDYLFAWIGCTTPFGKNVWKVMAQLGSRLFFLVLNQGLIKSDSDMLHDLINPTSQLPYSTRRDECRQAVHEVLESMFLENGNVRGVDWDRNRDAREVTKWIARCAMLLAKMRSEPSREKEHAYSDEVEYIPGTEESPYRAYAVLYNLARGHALVHGRLHLTHEDLSLMAEVTISTMPPQYGHIFRALVQTMDHKLMTREAQMALKVKSSNTVTSIMKALDQLGVMEFVYAGQGKDSYLKLRKEWEWCASEAFRTILNNKETSQKMGAVCTSQ